MAAIAYPDFQPRRLPARPHLQLVDDRRVREHGRRAGVYRRRRLGALLGLVVVVLVARAVIGMVTADAGPAVFPVAEGVAGAPAVVVAQPGDSYWSIAVRLGGEGDVRARVDALVHANGGSELQVGDRVIIPS